MSSASYSDYYDDFEQPLFEIDPNDKFFEFHTGYNFEEEWTERKMPTVSRRGEMKVNIDNSNEIRHRCVKAVPMNSPFRRKVSMERAEQEKLAVPVEHRGITLRQLRAIRENIKRRCTPEKWFDDFGKERLRPETVRLYDINKYIILPFTEQTQLSFVSSMPSTIGPQIPRWFVSHWWGEPFMEFIACVECFVLDFRDTLNCNRGIGMTEDTPIWVCAYANNQWDLSDTITIDPFQSGFTRALEAAQYRTLTILDRDGTVFSRIWCILELFLTFLESSHQGEEEGDQSTRGLWTVYTACDMYKDGPVVGRLDQRSAVGLASHREIGYEDRFPFDIVAKSLDIKIEKANASVASDRLHILNAIVGNTDDFDAAPPETHEEYTVLNNFVIGAFASSIWLLQKASQQENKTFWKKMITQLSKSTRRGKMKLDFNDWKLNENQAVELISRLPLTTYQLKIDMCSYGYAFAAALANWIRKAKNLKTFCCENSCFGRNEQDGGRDAGITLAEAFGENKTIKAVRLWGTDLLGERNAPQWAAAIERNTSLEVFLVQGFALRLPKNYDKKSKIESYVGGQFLISDGVLFDEGYISLAEGIKRNQSLKVIGLEFHGASREGIVSLGPALMMNETITKVCIDEGFEARVTTKKGIKDLRMYVNYRTPQVTFPKYLSYVEREFELS